MLKAKKIICRSKAILIKKKKIWSFSTIFFKKMFSSFKNK